MPKYADMKQCTMTIGAMRKLLDESGMPDDTPIGLIGSESVKVECITVPHTMVEIAPDGTEILLFVDFCASGVIAEIDEENGNLIDTTGTSWAMPE